MLCKTNLAARSASSVKHTVPVRGLVSLRSHSVVSSQRNIKTQAAFNISDLQNLPQGVLYGGAAAIAALLGVVGYAATQDPNMATSADANEAAADITPEPEPLPRQNAVLVFGATGKLGRKVVEKLVKSGRTVIAAVRNADKASEVYKAAGLQEGYQQPVAASTAGSGGILITADGVDVTNPETLTAELFEGVTQVVSALGPIAGRLPDGSFGIIDNMTPERVEAQGVAHIMAAIAKHAPGITANKASSSSTVLPMRTADDLAVWERLDDVIMGGNSSSGLSPADDGSSAIWTGDLITEGGGFCGARTKSLNLDLSEYDGLQLRVKGDGQIFKFNIKTTDQEDTPESTYQATFDTSPEGDWATVRLPWHNFVPVKRAQSDPNGAPLNPSAISKLGLVLSRFEFNKMPNPCYKPGPFQLLIDGGIAAYKAPKPAVVIISSAGVERNAIIGDDAVARKKDIPIIQLNPNGVLNYKYDAECSVRASGLPYTVIRCTGLDDKGIESTALLEADQGDVISGKVSRDEAADVVVAALSRPDAANKTLELRRSEAADAQGKTMSEAAYTRMFLKLAEDRNRWRVGLPPFPRAVPPPAPPSEERTKEILKDPRVQAVREREQKAKQPEQEPAKQQEQEKELVKANA